jgi:NADH dehydrogenase
MSELDVVTGAFGYTGRFVARHLLAMGRRVRTLIAHPERSNPFGSQVEVLPFNFDNPAELVKTLEGADTLYNTYWVRFPRGGVTYELAIENTRTLIRAAEQAGVRKFVHFSVTNPSESSPLPYYRGKAVLEKLVAQSRLSHAVIRPTLVFGEGDILVNNIAWLLRRFPVFAIPGGGTYKLQPIFAEDLAEIAVSATQEDCNTVLDAAGPEIFTYEELVCLVARALQRKPYIVHFTPGTTFFLSRLLGLAVGDVLLTREEIAGLMANLLVSGSSPTGRTRFIVWLEQNAAKVGVSYASELARHYR